MTDERIITYLLQELPEDESERFEDELFAGNDWETDLQSVENDLVDSYLRRELSPERTRRFEEHYLHSEEGRERVAFAAALMRRVEEQVPEPGWFAKLIANWNAQPQTIRWAAGFAVLVLLFGTIWFVKFRTPREQTSALLYLSPANPTRSAGNKVDSVDLHGKEVLKVTLALPDKISPTSKFTAELRNGVGENVPLGEVPREGSNLVVTIPASRLPAGYYQIQISASENGGDPVPLPGVYQFKVE